MVKVVFVTCPADEAAALAHELVKLGVAACVNQLPQISSTYLWDNKIQEDQETLLVIKTSAQALPPLRSAVLRLHSYDTPEVLVLETDTESSNQDYIDWVLASTSGARY